MLKLAFRNVFRSKQRSFLLIFGITVTLALEMAVIVTVDTIYADFLFDNRNQNYSDISVHPKKWVSLAELQNLTSKVHSVPGVQKASEVYYISADVIQNETGYPVNALIYGVNFHSHPDVPILNVTEGFRTGVGRTIIISQTVKDFMGLSLGETIELPQLPEIGFKGAELIVGGIFSAPPFFGNREAFAVILIDINTMLDLFEITPEIDSLNMRIDVTTRDFIEIRKISENIKDFLGPEYDVFVGKEISELQVLGIKAYSIAMNIVILASLLVEFLFTTNILTIAVRERQKEYGILRTVGISTKQVFLLLFYEILVYSVIGGILGVIVGISFSNLLVGVIDQFYPSLDFQAVLINPASVITVFLSGILVAFFSGIFPLYLIIREPIIQNIHSKIRTAKKSSLPEYWRYTVIIGIVLAFTGYFLSNFSSTTQFLDFSLFSIQFMTIVLIFAGTLFVEAGLLFFLPKAGELFFKTFKVRLGLISMRNIAREFQRSFFTIMTSSIALTFIILVGVVSSTIIASVPQYYQGQWGNVDLVVKANDPGQAINFSESLLANERIKQVAYVQEIRTEISESNGYVYGVDPTQYSIFAENVYDSILDVPSFQFLETNTSAPSIINSLISEDLYRAINKPMGSNISMKTSSNNTVNIRIAAIIKGNIFLGNGRYLYIGTSYFQELFNSSLAQLFVCDVIEGFSLSETEGNLSLTYPFLKEVIGIGHYGKIIENSLIFQANLFQILFFETFILAGIAQFVGVLMSTLQMEREMGIMRSMGLSKWGVFTIFLVESVTLGITALFFGFFDGLFSALLLVWYISLSIPITLNFPLDHVALWLFVSFLFTIASTIIPAYKSSQKEVVATISARPIRSLTEQMLKKLDLPKLISFENILIPAYFRHLSKLIMILYYIIVIFLIIIIIRGMLLGEGIFVIK
ncbi:hypothetical protein CEE45_10285 [Candidatus Heimdallarchaeota archaeon B3_Heim]|nr:MAG: hypothetical protein CEE45_10285 [Candidatus Heimdallarchaeota archaeon B3_Heim]